MKIEWQTTKPDRPGWWLARYAIASRHQPEIIECRYFSRRPDDAGLFTGAYDTLTPEMLTATHWAGPISTPFDFPDSGFSATRPALATT